MVAADLLLKKELGVQGTRCLWPRPKASVVRQQPSPPKEAALPLPLQNILRLAPNLLVPVQLCGRGVLSVYFFDSAQFELRPGLTVNDAGGDGEPRIGLCRRAERVVFGAIRAFHFKPRQHGRFPPLEL